MGFRRISACVIAVVIFASPSLHAQAKEQTAFNADDKGVKNPVTIPADVLEALKSDSFAADAFREEVPSSCFSASAIRLGPRVDDLIVEAAGALRGANVNMFWVFLTTPNGHRLVLKAPAHDLIVENPRTHEYRDITMRSATGGTVTSDDMRFNGKQYALHHRNTEAVH
jgi:hypothetical protein